MALNVINYALAKKYVDDTASALGAVKGAPCTIQNIEYTDDGAVITFS